MIWFLIAYNIIIAALYNISKLFIIYLKGIH